MKKLLVLSLFISYALQSADEEKQSSWGRFKNFFGFGSAPKASLEKDSNPVDSWFKKKRQQIAKTTGALVGGLGGYGLGHLVTNNDKVAYGMGIGGGYAGYKGGDVFASHLDNYDQRLDQLLKNNTTLIGTNELQQKSIDKNARIIRNMSEALLNEQEALKQEQENHKKLLAIHEKALADLDIIKNSLDESKKTSLKQFIINLENQIQTSKGKISELEGHISNFENTSSYKNSKEFFEKQKKENEAHLELLRNFLSDNNSSRLLSSPLLRNTEAQIDFDTVGFEEVPNQERGSNIAVEGPIKEDNLNGVSLLNKNAGPFEENNNKKNDLVIVPNQERELDFKEEGSIEKNNLINDVDDSYLNKIQQNLRAGTLNKYFSSGGDSFNKIPVEGRSFSSNNNMLALTNNDALNSDVLDSMDRGRLNFFRK